MQRNPAIFSNLPAEIEHWINKPEVHENEGSGNEDS